MLTTMHSIAAIKRDVALHEDGGRCAGFREARAAIRRAARCVFVGVLGFALPAVASAQSNNYDSRLLAASVLHSEYTIEGISLGARVDFQAPLNRDFQCRPSTQFVGFTLCQKRREMSEARGAYISDNTLLHAADGTAVYINRSLAPAFFNGNEAQADIDFRTKRFGQAPSRFIPMPANSGVPFGMIVAWGKIGLEPVPPNVIRDIADGRPVQVGFMIDHIGNLRRSAVAGLPIYRYSGGAGYVWAASWNTNGIGTLQFLTTDPSLYIEQSLPAATAPSSSDGCRENWVC